MPNYNDLSEELQKRIIADRESHWVNPYAFRNEDVLRRNMNRDKNKLLRPSFVRDCKKLCIYQCITDMQTKLRYFLYIKMTIFQDVPVMCNWYLELREISGGYLD